ncbi:MAG: DUF819 family protein [Firmicutes bacterium]|nr:DUF819 family protein [Bacillota bacterium]
MALVIWSVILLLFPVAILSLTRRFPFLESIGPILLCYAAGLILGNLGILPAGFGKVQTALATYSVPIALPLLFFSFDARQWSRLAGSALLSFFLETVAVLVAATVAFLAFSRLIGPEAWKAVGMLIGCYTGGTLNLAAIGTALKVNPDLFMAVNVADMFVCPFYLLLAVTVLRRLLLFVLPPFQHHGLAEAAVSWELPDYRGFFTRKRLRAVLTALGLAVLVLAIGGGIASLTPGEYGTVVAILLITTLGIAGSFIPYVHRLEESFPLGNYFLLLFSLAISSMANLRQLLVAAPAALVLVGFMVFFSAFIHVLLAALFKIDAETMIITSIAGIFSPPFVPMVAAALKNRALIATGVLTGILGWVIGTYLGIGYGYLLHALFG